MLTESETLDVQHGNLVLNKPYLGFTVQNFATQSMVHGPALAVTWEPPENADSQACQIRIAQGISLCTFPFEGRWSAASFYYTFTFPEKK
mgnify:CR=1 FL=1